MSSFINIHFNNILFVVFISTSLNVHSQQVTLDNAGIKIGLILNFGSHVNQLGVKIDAFANYQFFQINIGNSTTYSLNNLGTRKRFFENRLSLGASILGGKKNMEPDFIWGGLRHQTNYSNAIGYNYIWYRDNIGTSQNSGGWTFQLSHFQLFFENDIFAGTGRDKYRTGHLMLSYRNKNANFQLGTKLWTGETRGSEWVKTKSSACPNGFRILENLPFGKTSHGIFYGGITYLLPYGNTINGQIGIDSEQIRHGFQNKISHDLILFPKFIERKTPHYPRLDENGCIVHNKESIRKDKLYIQIGLNNLWSY